MIVIRAALVVVLFVMTSCRSARNTGEEQVVVVNVLATCPTRSVVGAEVELRGADGRILTTAVTGVDGAAVFPGATFRRGALLIACERDHSCGALKVGIGEPGTRYVIALPPLVAAQ